MPADVGNRHGVVNDQPGDGRLEQAGRGGKEDRQPLLGSAHGLGQSAVMPGLRRIQRLEMQPVEKHAHAAPPVCRHEFFQRGPREIAKALIVEIGPGRADDLQLRRQQPIGMQSAKRGQQHALGQIARRAEK